MSYRRIPIEEEEEDDDDDDAQLQHHKKPKKKKKKRKEKEKDGGFERKLMGARNLIMMPLKKFEKVFTRKKRPPPAPFPYSEEEFANGCHLCFVQPKVLLDSPIKQNPGAKTSSYHDFLRSLIERNDFYSPECNVHRKT